MQLHPDNKLPTSTYQDLLRLIQPIYNKSLRYLAKGDRQGLLNLLPGELRRLADVEMTRASVDVNSGKDLSKYIYGKDWNKTFPEFDKNMNYQFSVFFEYLLAEVLELAGNVTRDESKKNLTFDHIKKAIKNDEELNKVFRI